MFEKMAEGNSKMNNQIAHFENEDTDLDDEFFKFLMKTKENFSKLSPEPERKNSEEVDDESDLVFMKFIAQLKQDLPDTLEKENQSPFSLKCSSPLKKQRSYSVVSDDNTDFKPKTPRSKSASADVSFALRNEELITTTDFPRKRETYSQKLYEYFNRKVFNNRLQTDMLITWSDLLRSTAGRTHCKRKNNEYSCTIELSTKVLTTFDRLRDTLLHEMCHAAVWIVNKSRDRHGPLWQTWASRCKIILPHIDVPVRCHAYEISYRFTYKCRSCTWKCGRHSKSLKLENVVCPKCNSKLTLVKS